MEKYSSLTGKYLLKHKGRTILTLFGIIVAVAMFSAIFTFYYSGKESQIESTKERSGNFEVLFSKLSTDKLTLLKNNAEIKNGGAEKKLGSYVIENVDLTDSIKSMQIKAYDEGMFNNIFKLKLSEGRLPQNSSEIIVDKKFYNVLKDKNNSSRLNGKLAFGNNAENKDYKIVGAFESSEISSYGITFLDGALQKEGSFTYYANLKEKKDKIGYAKKIASDSGVSFDVNSELLYLYGQGPDKQKNDGVLKIFIIVTVFVVICTVVVIYNAFNISVMERVKHYGILRSIGATKKQIRNLVFKEAFIMSIIAIPIGILCGYLGLYITINLMMNGNTFSDLHVVLKPQVVIIGAALGIITIFLSAFFPARTASKVSPIDAIRGTTVIKGEKVKRRRSFLSRLIFNFEGEVAYKNIKRSRKRFYITCISLTISLIMFIFFSNFADFTLKSNKILTGSLNVEAVFTAKDGNLLGDKFVERLKSVDGIKNIYKTNQYTVSLPIDKNKMEGKFLNSFKNSNKLKEYKNNFLIDKGSVFSFDENAFNIAKKVNKLKLDYPDFKDNKVIVVNKVRGKDNKKIFWGAFTSYKPGDKITIPVMSKEYINNSNSKSLQGIMDSGKEITLEVADVIEDDPIEGTPLIDGYGIIVSNETFSKLTGINEYNNILLDYSSNQYRDKLFEKLNVIADENKAMFTDVYSAQKEMDSSIKQLFVLVYGFVALIVVISTVNIINTVTINLLVKKREYAIFKAIGMTKGQFKKLVLLEGVLFGVFASLVGLPLSYLLTMYGIVGNNPLGDIGYKMSLWTYFSGAAGIIFITFIAALIPLRKLNDMNIVESLRLEE